MPFKGPDPLGTAGGPDNPDLPQSPADVRIVEGGAFIGYLLVNGPITERMREQIEQVVRTLGARGETVITMIIRDNGAVIDSNLADMNFGDGIEVTSVSPGVTLIKIPTEGITTTMLEDAMVTAIKIADGAVETAKIDDLAVTEPKLADAAVSPAKLLYPNPYYDSVGFPDTGSTPGTQGMITFPGLTAGAYLYNTRMFFRAEGSGAIGEVQFRMYFNGTMVDSSGTIRYETGVDNTDTLESVGVYNHTFTGDLNIEYYVNTVTGTINRKGGRGVAFLIPLPAVG